MLCTIAVDLLVFQVVYRHLNSSNACHMSKKKIQQQQRRTDHQSDCFVLFFPCCSVRYNCQAFLGLLGRKGSEGQGVRSQRLPSQTEGCIVDRKVKDTCGFRHVSVGQTPALARWVSRFEAVFHFYFYRPLSSPAVFTTKRQTRPSSVYTPGRCVRYGSG